MGKRIVITVIGTHGDVQPFVALAVTLKRRGYSPALAATSDYGDFIVRHGVEFVDMGGDVQAFLRQPQFERIMNESVIRHAPAVLRAGQRVLKEAAKRCWEAAQGADAIIFHNATAFSIDIAEALKIPAILTVFQPLYPTAEFPYFGTELQPFDPVLYRFAREPFAKSPRLDPVLNKLSYLLQRAQQTYWDYPRDQLRKSLLSLKPKRRGNAYRGTRGEPLTTLHAYSPSISPPPGDWPDSNVITGFWRLDDGNDWTPPAEFQSFLASGGPPIYLGFGSMPWGAQRNSEIVTKALTIWGGRVVVARGWGGLKPESLPPTVHVIDRAPHTRLFEYVKAVVHHGGAGTVHTGLLAGRPTFVVPQFFDQPYWGRRIYDLGLGPRPVPIRKLTPQILAAGLDDLDTTPSYAKAAAAMAEQLKLEDGTNRAVDMIEETIADFRPFAGRKGQLLGAAL